MSCFSAELSDLAAALDVPQPMRARIILELDADLGPGRILGARSCIGVLSLALLSVPTAGAAQTVALLAPYQIESVETRFETYEGEVTYVGVSFTRAPDSRDHEAGIPASELTSPEFVTIIGDEGWIHAGLLSVEKRCEFLCSTGEGEECHWMGLYVPMAPLADAGVPVAALPGRLDLKEFIRLEPGAGDGDGLARLEISEVAAPMLWERTPDWQPTYRVDAWNAAAGRLDLTIVQPGGDVATMPAKDCQAMSYEWLLRIDCGGLSLLASGGKPLLLSWPDYNSAKAEPIARFHYAGSRHYVVRLGSKAQDLVGLVSGEPAGWRARFRHRDWALLC